MQTNKMAEQTVATMYSDHQGADAQCSSCSQPTGSRPAKAGASRGPLIISQVSPLISPDCEPELGPLAMHKCYALGL